MLSAHQISKHYGIHKVLTDVSFSINHKDRIGLIGVNGCGKTTLMRILAGIDQPDTGTVTLPRPDYRLGYLEQGMVALPDQPISAYLGETLFSSDQSQFDESQLVILADRLSKFPNDETVQKQFDEILTRSSNPVIDVYGVLGPLGLAHFPLNTPVGILSGGQKTRLMLARLLMDSPNLLLLDEPTNHLDISMLEWLENWLEKFSGGVLVVSHDRAFLDNTVNTILELDPKQEGIRRYDGNYTDYIGQKVREQELQLQAFTDQQEQIDGLRAAAQHLRGLTKMKKGGKADSGDKFATGFFGNKATKNTAGRAKAIEARIEKILSEHRLERPKPSWQLKLDFGIPTHLSNDVVIAEDLKIGYTSNAPLLTGCNFTIRGGQRIAITGQNGAGKTSLLRTIMGIIPPLGGKVRIGASSVVGLMTQEQEGMAGDLSPLQLVQQVSDFNETEARHFLHYFLFAGDSPLRPNSEMSYGERTRLQLALLVAKGCNLLVLDEPINHLDIPSRARFEQALSRFEGTAIAVVHDRYFIEHFTTDLWKIENGVLTQSPLK